MNDKSRRISVGGRSFPLWGVALAFVGLGLLAYFPYLYSGFSGDDFIFISMLEGAMPYNPVLGFWSAQTDSYPGLSMIWWAQLGPGGAFLRPLASWTFTTLYWLFGRNAVPYHATLIVVHALVAFTAFLILRRLSGRDVPALLAALIFLICEDHGMTVAWIATLTDLLCALFLNLAFMAHIHSERGSKPWLFGLSLVLFLAALGSKETAAIYPGIIVAYEFIFARGLGDQSDRLALRARLQIFFRIWWVWAIPLVVFIAYLIVYRSLIPPFQSLMYWDPITQPGRYLRALMTNLPILFVGLLTQFLPSLLLFIPGASPFITGAGALLTVLLIWALLPYRNELAVWFALVAFVLGLLPGLATDIGERLLYFPSQYGLFLVAWLVTQIPGLRRRFTPDVQQGVQILGPVWGWYLLVSAVILPVILLLVFPSMWIPGLQLPENTIRESLPLIDAHRNEHVIYLNTDSSYNTFYLPDIYRYYRGEYIDLHTLSSFNGRVWARQASEQVVLLKTQDTGWLSNMFARTVRVTSEITQGDVYTVPIFTATVLGVKPDGQDIHEARFDFVLPLDDPALKFLYYNGRDYLEWEPSPEWELLNPQVDPFGF